MRSILLQADGAPMFRDPVLLLFSILAFSACDGSVHTGTQSRDGSLTLDARDGASNPETGMGNREGGPDGDCTALAMCCASLPARGTVYGCLILDGGTEVLCTPSLAALRGQGFCGAPDAGDSLGGGPIGTEPCTTLAQCCSELPATEKAACNQVASEGSGEACSVAQMSVNGEGYCISHGVDGGSPDCTALAQCCGPALPAKEQSPCETVSKEGNEQICSAKLAYLRGEGYCGG
jgi:hypothetical protein